ncbi:hypothetical protein B4U80_14002, partial [Leptotrombidium deliense]
MVHRSNDKQSNIVIMPSISVAKQKEMHHVKRDTIIESLCHVQESISSLMQIASHLQFHSTSLGHSANEINRYTLASENQKSNNDPSSVTSLLRTITEEKIVSSSNATEEATSATLTDSATGKSEIKPREANANSCPICFESTIIDPCRLSVCLNKSQYYCFICLEQWIISSPICPCCRAIGNEIIMNNDAEQTRTVDGELYFRNIRNTSNVPIRSFEDIIATDPFYVNDNISDNNDDDDISNAENDIYMDSDCQTDNNDDTYYPNGVNICGECNRNIQSVQPTGATLECYNKNNEHIFHFHCIADRVIQENCCTCLTTSENKLIVETHTRELFSCYLDEHRNRRYEYLGKLP